MVLGSETVVANRWITLRRDRCETGRGIRVADYYVVEKRDFAMAVALTEGDELILVRQYKHGIGRVVVECPAGYIDDGEEAVSAVERELREETGYRCDRVIPLAVVDVSPAVLTNRAHLFLCLGAERVAEQQLDATEDIEVLSVPFDAVVQGLLDGSFEVDLASAAAILLARQWLSRER